jgi:DNA-binding response OmpR family regulator
VGNPALSFFYSSMAARVLLIDDDQDILELLEYNLSREGYAVMTAADPVVALELVNSFQPNLVVLDVMMPGINGFEVCTSKGPLLKAEAMILFKSSPACAR